MGGRGSKQASYPSKNDTKQYALINSHAIHQARINAFHGTHHESVNSDRSSGLKSLPKIPVIAKQQNAFTPSPHNHSARKIPRYDPHMKKDQLGLRKSQSTGNLFSTPAFHVAQQNFYSKANKRQRHGSSSSQKSTESTPDQGVSKSMSTTTVNRLFNSKPQRKQTSYNHQLVQIHSSDLQILHEVGHGNFGTVYHALHKGTRDVALKTLNVQNASPTHIPIDGQDENMNELLHEAHIMTALKHPNVLRILGITLFGNKQQLGLVTDFMKDGSLLKYLTTYKEIFERTNPQHVTERLNYFGRQIFEAMVYLEDRKVIHRDLAARNCLIGENDILKVGDFGLTRLTECGLYKATDRSKCAPRWTAPEALFSQKYSSRSDVWSYGITLWEIYSLGKRPFGKLNNFTIETILRNSPEILTDHLPRPSPLCSEKTYTHIILRCLTYNAATRPRFRDLRERVSTILSNRTS